MDCLQLPLQDIATLLRKEPREFLLAGAGRFDSIGCKGSSASGKVADMPPIPRHAQHHQALKSKRADQVHRQVGS